jgi:hypothetical protein
MGMLVSPSSRMFLTEAARMGPAAVMGSPRVERAGLAVRWART